jgi:ABC-2 type transport system permease protein
MNESASTVTVGYIYYFSYLAYTLLAVILLGVSSIMLAFNKPDVQRRMACGPIAARSINLQLAAGHAVFALSCWAVMMLFALILYGKALLSSEILGWLTLNSLIFTIVCTSIGLLVGSLIRDHNAQGAAVNMITLGMSFICGVFVPQSILSPAVLAFAKFLPGYWYIRAHESIRDLLLSPLATRAPLLSQMLIQLGFAAAIFSVTLLLSKERRASVS